MFASINRYATGMQSITSRSLSHYIIDYHYNGSIVDRSSIVNITIIFVLMLSQNKRKKRDERENAANEVYTSFNYSFY